MIKEISKMKTGPKIILAVLVSLAIVCLWRGLWGLLDIYLLPNDRILSLWISIIFGISILILSGYLKKLM
jgi:hypothetical protein